MQQLIMGEPFRAIFYSPYYVAEALGAFGRHGVEVQMVTAGSADLAAQNILDGATDGAWSGPMRPMLERSRNPDSPLRSFCGVVMRDPFVLVGREHRRISAWRTSPASDSGSPRKYLTVVVPSTRSAAGRD
ncbi:MAG: hypothetical protein JOZ87_10470 [Chloroflexi bacterium]|nr:hypothetical protein [Chloroflexota bacterium]